MEPAGKRFVHIFLAVTLSVFIACVAFAAWADPFWIWSKNPPWLAKHGGINKVLDLHMRFAKSLQMLTHPYDDVIIGSSRVYRGFNFKNEPENLWYNLGIGDLRMLEMRGFLTQLLYWRHPKTVIIGLDYFMFDAHDPFKSGYDPMIARRTYPLDAAFTSVMSFDALTAARDALTNRRQGTQPWFYNGFETTYPLSAEQMKAALGEMPANLSAVVPDEKAYAAFGDVLHMLKTHGIEVKIYLSPMHQMQFEELEKTGTVKAYQACMARVNAIAAAEGVALFDFTHAFSNEPELITRGESAHWIDPWHFKPEVGAWIMSRIKAGDSRS